MPDIDDGATAEVQGSGAKPYVLKNIGGVYSCSCPAWRNQSLAIDKRTCKHLRAYRGNAAEATRVGTDVELAAKAASAGRKLRPDEKAKLHGPPVLLAQNFEDVDVDPTGWWCSEKLDGVRAYWDGTRFVSRQGNTFHAPDWFTAGLPQRVLDGELWLGRGMFQKTISIVKRQTPDERWRYVKYQIFDAPDATSAFEDRLAGLSWLAHDDSPPYVYAVVQTRVPSRVWLKGELARVVALGGEGLMLRKPGSLYEARRSPTLLKLKLFEDAEGVVIGHEPGDGRHKGRLGALTVCMADGVTQFNVGTGFSDQERENPPPVGTPITYRFTGRTDEGKPKCASFVCVRDYEG